MRGTVQTWNLRKSPQGALLSSADPEVPFARSTWGCAIYVPSGLSGVTRVLAGFPKVTQGAPGSTQGNFNMYTLFLLVLNIIELV